MGDPTRPTRPLGQPEPPPGGRVVHEREVVVGEDPVLEELRRVRFWSYFASAVGVAASILAVIALIVALGNNNNDNNSNAVSQAEVDSLSSDVSTAKADAARARSTAQDNSDQLDSLSNRVKALEKSTADQAAVKDDVSQIKQDLSDLSDRVDQVEKAQEQAASGGP